MKLYRFKEEFSSYGASRSGDPSFDRLPVLVFDGKIEEEGRAYYPVNHPRIWAYFTEIEEVTDQAVIDAFKKEMEQDVEILLEKKGMLEDLGAYAVKRNGAFYCQNGIACHAGFNGKGADSACTWNLALLSEDELNSIRELIEWLINDSPWVHCIAPRWDILSYHERADRAMYKPVPVNMDAPANEVVGFAVAMRTITEHEWTIPTYLALRELGASKAVAFMLTGFIQKSGNNYIVYVNNNWHHYLDSRMKVADVCKFFKEGYFLEGRNMAAFNKAQYNRIASQVAPIGNGEDTFTSIILKHTTGGGGWNDPRKVDVQSLIQEVNQIWSKA